jgi:hypothetical protein
MVSIGQSVPPGEIVSTADSRVIMHGVPWSHYEVLLAIRGEKSVPRLAYLEGTLEIMTPSETHERLKSRIGQLIEVYLLHRDLEFEAVGSWTLKSAPEFRGAEPDECYKIGDLRGAVPHLAIEVNWTSGGIDKLAIYERLGVARGLGLAGQPHLGPRPGRRSLSAQRRKPAATRSRRRRGHGAARRAERERGDQEAPGDRSSRAAEISGPPSWPPRCLTGS